MRYAGCFWAGFAADGTEQENPKGVGLPSLRCRENKEQSCPFDLYPTAPGAPAALDRRLPLKDRPKRHRVGTLFRAA